MEKAGKPLKTQIPFLLTLVFIPFVGYFVQSTMNNYTQFVLLLMLINVVLALSLNLVSGFTGQFSLGHAGFMAVGAYVSAFLSTQPEIVGTKLTIFTGEMSFFNFPIYAVAGGLVAAAAGYLVGLPSLRLKGDYLAIVTLGFSEIIRVILLNMEIVGGARGMYAIPGPQAQTLFGLEFTAKTMIFLWAAFWVVVTLVVHWRIVHSTHGRSFLSVREDEIAAEAMGINTTKMKVKAFVISSFFAGIAGSLFAHVTNYLNPATFGFNKSVDAIIMVVLGGLGSLTGSIVAAVLVTIIPEFILRDLQAYTKVDLRMIIYSLTLILFMIMRPQGIFGMSEITDFFKGRARKPTAAVGGARK